MYVGSVCRLGGEVGKRKFGTADKRQKKRWFETALRSVCREWISNSTLVLYLLHMMSGLGVRPSRASSKVYYMSMRSCEVVGRIQ